MGEVTSTLHPKRTKRATQTSYYLHPVASGGEIIHALTADRYLVMIFDDPSPGSQTNDPELRSWELRTGPAPREDITIGRAFTPGSFRFYY